MVQILRYGHCAVSELENCLIVVMVQIRQLVYHSMWNLNMDLELRSYDEQSKRGPVEWPDGPAQPEPAEPAESGGAGQPQYGAYDSNHGGQYPPQGAPGAQDTQNQQAQNGQPQGGPNQNPYYGPYATIRTMARTASRHGGRTVGGIRRTANRIAKRTGSRMVHGAIKVNPAGSRPTGMSAVSVHSA